MNTNNMISTPYYDFFKLEKEMNLFSFRYKGVHYWQLVRFGLLKRITTNGLQLANSNVGRSIKNEVIGAFKEARKAEEAISKISDVDIIQIRPCVTITKEGKLDDHQFDYLTLGDKYRVLDLYALGSYTKKPICVKYSLALAEKKVIISKVRNKIIRDTPIIESQNKMLEVFLEKINSIYSTKFIIGELDHHIVYSVNCYIAYKEYYKRIFKHLSPKIIMEYPHYDEHMFAANGAAKELGIKTIELQHGRINAHEAYWYEDQSMEGKLLPDYFFVYGEWWKKQINLPEFCKVCVVGNPYLERQIQLYPKKHHEGTTVSVFSNPQNGKVLSELVFKIQGHCIENNIHILYKLHPNERSIWKQEYPLLEKMNNTTIIEDGNVYNVLAESDIAIGVNSTVFFEALAYSGIRLLIYTVGDYEGMKPLLENGLARAVTESSEIIEELRGGKSTDVGDKEIKNMWESDAIKNINKEIEIIVGSK